MKKKKYIDIYNREWEKEYIWKVLDKNIIKGGLFSDTYASYTVENIKSFERKIMETRNMHLVINDIFASINPGASIPEPRLIKTCLGRAY